MLTLATHGTSDKVVARDSIPSCSGRVQPELVWGTHIRLDSVTAMTDCPVRESMRGRRWTPFTATRVFRLSWCICRRGISVTERYFQPSRKLPSLGSFVHLGGGLTFETKA